MKRPEVAGKGQSDTAVWESVVLHSLINKVRLSGLSGLPHREPLQARSGHRERQHADSVLRDLMGRINYTWMQGIIRSGYLTSSPSGETKRFWVCAREFLT